MPKRGIYECLQQILFLLVRYIFLYLTLRHEISPTFVHLNLTLQFMVLILMVYLQSAVL